MERIKVVQELSNKRIVVENKYYIIETSHLCPDQIPDLNVSNSMFQDKVNTDNLKKNNLADNDHVLNPVNKIEIGVPKKLIEKLTAIHKEHSEVFDGDISSGYNGYSGDHEVDFNFNNNLPPPVHHGCVPSYTSREDNVLMQSKIDQLEDQGVVAKIK